MKKPLEYNAASAQTVQELANALDRINELRLQLEQTPKISECVNTLQSMLEFGISLAIFEDKVLLGSKNMRCTFKCSPEDVVETISCMAELEQRLVK